MPIYSYRCDNCGVQFDQHQHFDEAPLTVCPECQEKALKKLIQPVGIVFKGSGFYVTDNRKASNAASGPNGKGSDKADGGRDSSSKPESGSQSSTEKPAKDSPAAD